MVQKFAEYYGLILCTNSILAHLVASMLRPVNGLFGMDHTIGSIETIMVQFNVSHQG